MAVGWYTVFFGQNSITPFKVLHDVLTYCNRQITRPYGKRVEQKFIISCNPPAVELDRHQWYLLPLPPLPTHTGTHTRTHARTHTTLSLLLSPYWSHSLPQQRKFSTERVPHVGTLGTHLDSFLTNEEGKLLL